MMMLSRRAALAAALVPAAARAAPHTGMGRAHRKGTKEPLPTGDPVQTPIGPVETLAKWAYVQDFTTGAVLLDKNAGQQMPPSSMVKLMTIYLTYEALKKGRLKLSDPLTISQTAASMGGSKMFLVAGQTATVEDLIRGTIVASGNDSATVLAESIGGTQEHFVEMMNAKARELGLAGSHFANPTGWPDPVSLMTCRDIATLGNRIIVDFPEYYHYDSERTFKYNNIEQPNRHPMVQAGTADGLKTGHTDAGGFGLVASSLRDGRRVTMVLNGMTSMHERAQEAERLMNWAFSGFENIRLFAAGQPVDNARVWLGTEKLVPMVSNGDLVVTLPRSWRETASIRVTYDGPIKAPVVKGQPIGSLVLRGQGVPAMDVPLLAANDIPRLSLPMRGLAVLTHMVSGG